MSLLLADLLSRSIVTRDGHIEYLFGKRWRYLVPFDHPSEFPSATPEPGAYRRYDPVLAWTIAESGQEPPLYFSDRNGYRCSQAQFEASATTGPGPERVDVIALGDSFTHGDEVLFEQAWPHQRCSWALLRATWSAP